MSTTTFPRGTSYVSTEHNTPFTYIGRARAMGNTWNSQRVTRASFVYRRGGQNVIGWQRAYAGISNCTWPAGPETKKTVWDSFQIGAPKTTFHYEFYYLHPSAC